MRFFFGTLIGYRVEVVKASNINYEGINGVVLDETRNTLVIKGLDGEVYRVIKRGAVFKVYRDGDKLIFDGDKLVGDVVRRVVEL
jgi:RNase P/RNase MRP subunit p29